MFISHLCFFHKLVSLAHLIFIGGPFVTVPFNILNINDLSLIYVTNFFFQFALKIYGVPQHLDASSLCSLKILRMSWLCV